MAITILDCALAHGANADADGCISGEQIERAGFAMFGGCQRCGAALAAYNAFPARSGCWRCGDCIGDDGFDTVAQFDRYNGPNDPDRVRRIAADMWHAVFAALDAEVDISGADAGRAATAAEHAILRALGVREERDNECT